MNVAKVATKFVDSLEKESEFNNVDIIQIEKECVWHREYAIFIVDFDFDSFYLECHNDYTEVTFDNDGFDLDWQEFVYEQFPECTIKFHGGTGEVEIIGPNYDEFVKTYSEELEELSSKSGHHIF